MSDSNTENIGGKPSQAEGADPEAMPEAQAEEPGATGHPSQAEGEDPDAAGEGGEDTVGP